MKKKKQISLLILPLNLKSLVKMCTAQIELNISLRPLQGVAKISRPLKVGIRHFHK